MRYLIGTTCEGVVVVYSVISSCIFFRPDAGVIKHGALEYANEGKPSQQTD